MYYEVYKKLIDFTHFFSPAYLNFFSFLHMYMFLLLTLVLVNFITAFDCRKVVVASILHPVDIVAALVQIPSKSHRGTLGKKGRGTRVRGTHERGSNVWMMLLAT